MHPEEAAQEAYSRALEHFESEADLLARHFVEYPDGQLPEDLRRDLHLRLCTAYDDVEKKSRLWSGSAWTGAAR